MAMHKVLPNIAGGDGRAPFCSACPHICRECPVFTYNRNTSMPLSWNEIKTRAFSLVETRQ
jgi:hypothetical protein